MGQLRWARRGIVVWALLQLAACTGAPPSQGDRRATYRPRARDVTITTVPLLVKEEAALFPFLKRDFARGGVLEGKEVYAFVPNAITVVAGDTIHFTFVNPEDDAHSFVLPDFAVAIAALQTTRATYVARGAGIFPFVCAVTSHLPMMNGQLVVLPAATLADTSRGGARPGAN